MTPRMEEPPNLYSLELWPKLERALQNPIHWMSIRGQSNTVGEDWALKMLKIKNSSSLPG